MFISLCQPHSPHSLFHTFRHVWHWRPPVRTWTCRDASPHHGLPSIYLPLTPPVHCNPPSSDGLGNQARRGRACAQSRAEVSFKWLYQYVMRKKRPVKSSDCCCTDSLVRVPGDRRSVKYTHSRNRKHTGGVTIKGTCHWFSTLKFSFLVRARKQLCDVIWWCHSDVIRQQR